MGRKEDSKYSVDEFLIQEGINFFVHHPEEKFSRSDIQTKFQLTKATTQRLLEALCGRIALLAEQDGEYANSKIYYTLPSSQVDSARRQLSEISNLTEEDTMLLSSLLDMAESSGQYGKEMVKRLKDHLVSSRLLPETIPVLNTATMKQKMSPEAEEALEVIMKGIKENKAIKLRYKAARSSTARTWTIHPKGLFYLNGVLYVYSYVTWIKGMMSLDISRIQKAELLEKDAYIPDWIDSDLKNAIDPFGLVLEQEPTRVKVWIEATQAHYEREKEWPEDAVLEEQKDGSLILNVGTRSKWFFLNWISSLRGSARILEPASWAEEMKENYLKAAAAYD